MKLAIGCDEAAYQLKKTIMEHLSDIGVEYEDSERQREKLFYTRI